MLNKNKPLINQLNLNPLSGWFTVYLQENFIIKLTPLKKSFCL